MQLILEDGQFEYEQYEPDRWSDTTASSDGRYLNAWQGKGLGPQQHLPPYPGLA